MVLSEIELAVIRVPVRSPVAETPTDVRPGTYAPEASSPAEIVFPAPGLPSESPRARSSDTPSLVSVITLPVTLVPAWLPSARSP